MFETPKPQPRIGRPRVLIAEDEALGLRHVARSRFHAREHRALPVSPRWRTRADRISAGYDLNILIAHTAARIGDRISDRR